MSDDSNTDFVQFEPGEDSTVLRFPLSVDRANELIREFVATAAPNASLLDEIHILVSPEAIKRAYDAIPFPPGLEK